MDYVVSGDNRLVIVNYLDQTGLETIPDADSSFYSLFNEGVLVPDQERISVTPAGSATFIELDLSTYNTAPDADRTYRNMRVLLEYKLEGKTYYNTYCYRVIARPIINFDSQIVRDMLGTSSLELKDSDINLIETYQVLEREHPNLPSPISSYIAMGGAKLEMAERLVHSYCALWSIPKLKNLLMQAESDGVSSYTRGTVELDKLESSISRDIQGMILSLTVTTGSTYSLALTALSTISEDPFEEG